MRKRAIAFLIAALLLGISCPTGVLAAPESVPASSVSSSSAVPQAESAPSADAQSNVSDAAQTTGWPAPPTLYSQTAILMDADTGQVLCEKNANQRMYPASITKLMTLLLAMELGNPADLVTMTDEAVWEVPRYATHIALTPGETLTLEQLELAMMVESANDAANGIAAYLGGSLGNFAGMMNRKAMELGARGTQFVNANGLPDPKHYTTAYDMALITKAAYTFPEFRRLAGTTVYEIPPTNKQAQTRRLVNQQYMFSQGDTYPGAFAGKTGWTQESGKTLVTLAERGGITLIAVVMKPSGTVDGEFKDSTALLDYGFDQFNRTVIPFKRIPEFSDANGSWKADGEVAVLLPHGMQEDALTLSVSTEGKLLADAPIAYAGPFGTRLLEMPLSYQPNAPAEPVAADEIDAKNAAIWAVVRTCLKWAGIVVGGALALLLLVRLVVRGYFLLRRALAVAKRRRMEARIRRHERDLAEGQRLLMLKRAKQRMKRQQKERRETQRQERQERRTAPPVIDVTVDKEHKNQITVIDEDDN